MIKGYQETKRTPGLFVLLRIFPRARHDLGYEPQFADLDRALSDYQSWEEERRY